MFWVGQKVVCIVGRWLGGRAGEVHPTNGNIYTIRTTELLAGSLFLRFVEIKNAPQQYIDEAAEVRFYAGHFRPLVTTNIDIFTAMLAPKQRERVS